VKAALVALVLTVATPLHITAALAEGIKLTGCSL
jgi:hypothetical protein